MHNHGYAYFDENNIVGPAADAAKAFEALSIEVRTAGLTPVASKSAAHSSDQDMAAAAAAELGVLHARDGLVVAGTPIGTDSFVCDFLSRKRQEVHDEIQRLVDLPHPLTSQDKWVILSRSLQLWLQHLARTVPWAAASPHLQQHAADLRQATLTLFCQPDPRTAGLHPRASSLQLHLPLREGGFGVSDFPPASCAAAFISSAMRAASAFSAAATHLHPFSAPTSVTYACWNFLHA
jgi:hypothetical protein